MAVYENVLSGVRLKIILKDNHYKTMNRSVLFLQGVLATLSTLYFHLLLHKDRSTTNVQFSISKNLVCLNTLFSVYFEAALGNVRK